MEAVCEYLALAKHGQALTAVDLPKNWFLTFGHPSVSGLGIFAASSVIEPQKAQKGKKEAGDHEPGDHEPGDHEPGDHEPGDHEGRPYVICSLILCGAFVRNLVPNSFRDCPH